MHVRCFIAGALCSLLLLSRAEAAVPPKPLPKPPLQERAEVSSPEHTGGKQQLQAEVHLSAAGAQMSGEEVLIGEDVSEAVKLPDYPVGARIAMGKMQTYTVAEEDTFLDIARHYDLGYVELRAVNTDLDPWAPIPGEEMTIPTLKLLPRAKQEGVVVNLGDMRMYYFREPGQEPLTYPLGIGREGLQTPTGQTTITKKVAGPTWFPTDRMRKEKPWLPSAIAPGASNPLGTHAMYLGWSTFLIHGSNKPWGIGRRVSSGCMRMYPEDIVSLFDMVNVGEKVTVVDQPLLMGWIDDGFYLEANASKTQASEIEADRLVTIKPLTPGIRKVILDAAGVDESRIDWKLVDKVLQERKGYPILVSSSGRKKNPDQHVTESKSVYN